MKNAYKALFHLSYEGHRALADAQARCKIFTKAKLDVFLKCIQNQEEMIVMEEHKYRSSARPCLA